MNKLIVYTSIIVLSVNFSCNNYSIYSNEKPINQAKINNLRDFNVSTAENWSCDNFFEKVDGFQLDTIGGYIGEINRLKIVSNKFYVFDRYYAKKLKVYDVNGNHIYSIGIKGKGPGEFISFDDFDIDSVNNKIICCDALGKKFVFFDLNGNFIKERKLEFKPEEICINDDYIYCYTSIDNDYLLYALDRKNYSIVNKMLNKDYYDLNSPHQYPSFSSYNNDVFYTMPYCDTIYQLKKDQTIPYVINQTGNWSFTKNYNSTVSDEEKDKPSLTRATLKQIMSRSIFGYCGYFENDAYSLFLFNKKDIRPENRYYACYNKKDSVFNIINFSQDFSITYLLNPYYTSDIGTVAVYNTVSYNVVKEKIDKLQLSERVKKLKDHLDIESNPIILIFN
ncbi:MAG: 6-bladed beta-propeller [Marinilabiliaceae bacterium]|nr:6-bladed beta-propeller [Marinilabiliaceae bacterium]